MVLDLDREPLLASDRSTDPSGQPRTSGRRRPRAGSRSAARSRRAAGSRTGWHRCGASGHTCQATARPGERGTFVTWRRPRPSTDERDETAAERLDRNTIELLNELRVAGTGIQVMFGFLLIVPFNIGLAAGVAVRAYRLLRDPAVRRGRRRPPDRAVGATPDPVSPRREALPDRRPRIGSRSSPRCSSRSGSPGS